MLLGKNKKIIGNKLISTALYSTIMDFALFLASTMQKSKHTVSAYQNDIYDFIISLSSSLKRNIDLNDLENIELKHIRMWQGSRGKSGTQARSNARSISSVRMFFKYLNENNIITNSIIFNIKKPKLPQLLPKAIATQDVLTLIKEVGQLSNQEWQGKRDIALLLLIFSCGLRISEALSLTLSDIKNGSNILYIRGKGGKQRIVPLMEVVFKAINDYLAIIPFSVTSSDALFVSNTGKKYYPRTVQKKIQSARKIASLSDTITPHVLRHSCATSLLDSSGDIVKIKNLLGHSKLSTTQLYTKISPARLGMALDQVGYWNAKK